MRIITGSARGTKLRTAEGNETRPTSERVKEGIFSAIQFDLHDRVVLDLFAGSGQMSLEALSRGAQRAVIIDISKTANAIIKENAIKTKLFDRCRVLSTDWKEYAKGASGRDKFGLIFLDPPYKDGILGEVLAFLREKDLLEDNAIIVCESPKEGIPAPIDNMENKVYRYGKTYVTIFRGV